VENLSEISQEKGVASSTVSPGAIQIHYQELERKP
jgi:hypothetical protein